MSDGSSAYPDAETDSNTMLHVVYGLYALSFLVGIAVFIGVVVAYIKRGKATSSFQDSHLVWQIRTFWIAFFLGVAAIFLSLFLGWFGAVMLVAVASLFFVYRTGKGWYRLLDNRRIEEPEAWF